MEDDSSAISFQRHTWCTRVFILLILIFGLDNVVGLLGLKFVVTNWAQKPFVEPLPIYWASMENAEKKKKKTFWR